MQNLMVKNIFTQQQKPGATPPRALAPGSWLQAGARVFFSLCLSSPLSPPFLPPHATHAPTHAPQGPPRAKTRVRVRLKQVGRPATVQVHTPPRSVVVGARPATLT